MRRSFVLANMLASVAVAVAVAPAGLDAQRPEDVAAPRSLALTTPEFDAGGTERVGFSVSPLPAVPGARLRIRLEGADGPPRVLWDAPVEVSPTWDGLVGGAVVAAGRYDLVAEVAVGDVTQRLRRPLTVEVLPLASAAPFRLVESLVVPVRDVAQEERWLRNGLATIALGVATSLAASSLVGPAVQGSPPESVARYAVATAYVGGFVLAGVGGWRLWQRSRLEAVRMIAVPEEANIRANRSTVLTTSAKARIRMIFRDAGDAP